MKIVLCFIFVFFSYAQNLYSEENDFSGIRKKWLNGEKLAGPINLKKGSLCLQISNDDLFFEVNRHGLESNFYISKDSNITIDSRNNETVVMYHLHF